MHNILTIPLSNRCMFLKGLYVEVLYLTMWKKCLCSVRCNRILHLKWFLSQYVWSLHTKLKRMWTGCISTYRSHLIWCHYQRNGSTMSLCCHSIISCFHITSFSNHPTGLKCLVVWCTSWLISDGWTVGCLNVQTCTFQRTRLKSDRKRIL